MKVLAWMVYGAVIEARGNVGRYAHLARAISGTRLSLGSANIEQFLDSFAPDRRDNAELSEVGSDRINHRGLLADKQMARAMQHQATLLLRGLGWHKPLW